MVDLLLAAIEDRQFKHSDSHAVRRRNKVLSTKVSADLHNRFSLLAEYLFESGLSESLTPSALLHDIIEDLLFKYHDGLEAYGITQSLNSTNSLITNAPAAWQNYNRNYNSVRLQIVKYTSEGKVVQG